MDPATQSDLDRLVDAGLQLAEETLRAGRPLGPFALTLGEGGIEVLMSDSSGGDVVDQLWATLRSERDVLSGVAMVYDVRLPDGDDAVQVIVEHEDTAAPALALALPYEGSGDQLRTGQLSAASASRRLWA